MEEKSKFNVVAFFFLCHIIFVRNGSFLYVFTSFTG